MKIIDLYVDFSIPIADEGTKHYAPGWVNTHCPFCTGSQNYHLGYNLQDNFFTCYRCGWHSIPKTIAELLHISEKESYKLIKQYGGDSIYSVKKSLAKIKQIDFKLPSGVIPLQAYHKQYLEDRKFDPDYLEKVWSLMGTGPVSALGEHDYKLRILIPFIWDGEQVSFDSRDITGRASAKYKACPLEKEYIPHKDILYGRQDKWKDIGICVEGPTDVWRFGVNAFATSGIKYKPKQIRAISQHFKRVAVVFDGGEIQAQSQARKLVAELKFRGVDAFRVDIEGDPGGMKQSEADYLVKQLIQ